MIDLLKVTSAVALLTFAGAANAAVLDLESALNDGTTLFADGAVIVADPSTTLAVGDFVTNAVCPLGGFGCNGSMTLTFDADVNSVMFEYGFGNVGDSATLSIFDGLGGLLGTVLLTLDLGVSSANLSGFGTLRSILFDNTASTGAGYAYGNISYLPGAAVVPLPASLPLLLAGLGGLAVLRRRKAA